MVPINQIVSKGFSLADDVARYVKACGKRSILETRPLQAKINIDCLRLAPSATTDTLQLSKKVNNIRAVLGEKRGLSCLRFYDGERQVGYATYYFKQGKHQRGSVPDEWFVDATSLPKVDLTSSEALGRCFYETKPFMHIEEFMMSDKLGMEAYAQRASGKKYGTMCMQKVLEHAEKLGLGSRIELDAAIHGSAVNPAKFYAKIGFNSVPSAIAKEERFFKIKTDDLLSYKRIAKEVCKSEEEIKFLEAHVEKELKILQHRYSRTRVDGRYFNDIAGGRMWLEAPDVLRNYPL